MKSLFSFIFLFLFTNSAFAVNLCDSSCNLTISFPSGGSITAVESLTFTFGDAGLVDTVATNTAYVQGNTLILGVGEVLAFGAGGSLDLGTGGNLDYTNVTITTDGVIDVLAVGGTETVTLSTTTVTGGAIFNISGLFFNVQGGLAVDSTLNIISSDPNVTTGCGTTAASGSLTLSGSTSTVVIDTSSSCNIISTSTGIPLPIFDVTLGTNDTNNTTGTIAITPADIQTSTPADTETSDSGSASFFFTSFIGFIVLLFRVYRINLSIR